MAKTYTEEQLNTFDKATLIQLLLMQQSQLQEIDKKLQLLLEQAAVLKNNRFGKKSEKLGIENQVCFMEVDGDIVFFNEAEAVNALVPEDEEKSTKPKNAKTKGKRTADIKDLPVIHVDHKMTESELITEFGEDGWYQLEDEIYRRYRFTPMKIEIEEHHVGVYKSKKDNHFKKAEHPAYLFFEPFHLIFLKKWIVISVFRVFFHVIIGIQDINELPEIKSHPPQRSFPHILTERKNLFHNLSGTSCHPVHICLALFFET